MGRLLRERQRSRKADSADTSRRTGTPRSPQTSPSQWLAAEASSDLVNRRFPVDAPNRLWIADITEHPIAEGRLYCAAVMDAYPHLIIGWSLAGHMRTELVTDARHAILRRQPDKQLGDEPTILHPDHGAQYTSWAFGLYLIAAGLLVSMGTVGDCYDNAMMESLWGALQLVELLDSKQWHTRNELGNAIFEWG